MRPSKEYSNNHNNITSQLVLLNKKAYNAGKRATAMCV